MYYIRNNRNDLATVSRNFSMLMPLLGLGLTAFLGSKSKNAAKALQRTDSKEYDTIMNKPLDDFKDLQEKHKDWTDAQIYNEMDRQREIRDGGYALDTGKDSLLGRLSSNVGLGLDRILHTTKKWTVDNMISIPSVFKKGKTWEGIGRSALAAAELAIPAYMVWKHLKGEDDKKNSFMPPYPQPYYPPPMPYGYPQPMYGMPHPPVPYRFSRPAGFRHREFIIPFRALDLPMKQYKNWRGNL
jgi:hypothetical protein